MDEMKVEGRIEKDLFPHLTQPSLERISRWNCNDGSREFIPTFYNPQRRPSDPAMALVIEFLVGMPS